MPQPNDLQLVWTSPQSYATTLLVLFVDHYGVEGLGWDPQTIALEIHDDFGVEPTRPNFDRLMTGIALVTTDLFYTALPEFIRFCNVLAGSTYAPDHFDPADADEIAWAVTEAALIDPPDSEDVFTQEIRRYIGETLTAEGIIHPPSVLQMAIRDDAPEAIAGEYDDDPVMFNSIYKFEQEKTAEINRQIRDGLRRMHRQLQALPLQHGESGDVLQRILQRAPT